MITLFVRNFPYSVSESDLRAIFSVYGPVGRCIILLDKQRKSRGCAFVTLEREAGERAMGEMHECEWLGRTLYIYEAEGRAEREAQREAHAAAVRV